MKLNGSLILITNGRVVYTYLYVLHIINGDNMFFLKVAEVEECILHYNFLSFC